MDHKWLLDHHIANNNLSSARRVGRSRCSLGFWNKLIPLEGHIYQLAVSDILQLETDLGRGGRGAAASAAMLLLDRLYFIWLFTSCPAASADIKEISPANTVAATTLASDWALAPGDSMLAPFTPSRFKQAD